MSTTRILAATGLLAALLGGTAHLAAAHEKGAVRLTPAEVPVGGQLQMNGERLTKNARFRVELRGTLETFPLGGVRTDTLGTFELRATLPAGAKAGSYTVAVVSTDDDEIVAQSDFTITPSGSATGGGMQGMAGMNMAGMNMAGMPSAKPMKVDVSTSAAQVVTIWAIILLSLAVGAWLLSVARRSEAAIRARSGTT